MLGISMRQFCFAWVLLFAASPGRPSPQQSQIAPAPLWSWFGNCRDKKYMGLEVSMKGKLIYRSSFHICRMDESYEDDGPQKKIVAFVFRGGYTFQGEYHTARTETIEGNVWQAGTDPGVLLLGVSFSTPKRILLNTVHFCELGRESTTLIDRGLMVRTFPIRRR
jgi:hypothetical protein